MWHQGDLTTLAFCWRLQRTDGVALGFTSHDRDLTIEDFLYRAAPGMVPSAVVASDGLDVDTLDLAGALTSEAIREEDLSAGRWDGARLRLIAVDWSDTDAPAVHLARGELGEIGIRDRGFTAELRGPTALLERPVVEQTSPECRASLGDRRCRIDLSARTRIVSVASVVDGATLDVDVGEPEVNAYGYGWLRWIEGPNSGLRQAVLRSDGVRIFLREPATFEIAPGTRLELGEGCDRLFATCRDRFQNVANFRGEPHLPGMDLLTRYPGAG